MNKKTVAFTLIVLILSACTQSLADTTPILPPATVTPTLTFGTPISGGETGLVPFATFTPITQPTFEGGTGTYAVILVLDDDVLNIRSGPGVEYSVVGTLAPGETGIVRTGRSSSVGDDQWVEIRSSVGSLGWVNADFLTEYVTPLAFCEDARSMTLLRNFEAAVTTSDGEMLKSLVSPVHGLDVVYIRSGMIANYTPEEANWAFQSAYEVDWGLEAGSGETVEGSFPEIILPALQEVFTDVSFACNEVVLGGATYVAEWPGKYANINFYSLHKPGTEPFAGMDWRTWLTGVEYVNGEPYLFALLNYQWEP